MLSFCNIDVHINTVVISFMDINVRNAINYENGNLADLSMESARVPQ